MFRNHAKYQRNYMETFAEELTELNHKGFLGWRGHKLKNYFTYKKLIKEYGK